MNSRRLSQEVREFVAERAGYCCEYCLSQKRYCPDSFDVDHVHPRAAGGANVPSNLAYSCHGCNGSKQRAVSGLDPLTGERTPLFHPRQDDWSDHFHWSHDFLEMFGKTAKGRATVARLKLNREGVVNLREALAKLGRHPPRRVATASRQE